MPGHLPSAMPGSWCPNSWPASEETEVLVAEAILFQRADASAAAQHVSNAAGALTLVFLSARAAPFPPRFVERKSKHRKKAGGCAHLVACHALPGIFSAQRYAAATAAAAGPVAAAGPAEASHGAARAAAAAGAAAAAAAGSGHAGRDLCRKNSACLEVGAVDFKFSVVCLILWGSLVFPCPMLTTNHARLSLAPHELKPCVCTWPPCTRPSGRCCTTSTC